MHTRNFIIFWYIVIYWEIKGETNLKIVQKFGRDHFRHFVGIGKKSSRSVFGIPIEIGNGWNILTGGIGIASGNMVAQHPDGLVNG